MLFGLKRPCRECPFRKASLKGYLGGDSYDPEAFINPLLNRHELAPGVFVSVGDVGDMACHMDIDNALEHVRNEFDIDEPEVEDLDRCGIKLQHCAGALHFLSTSCKMPWDKTKVAAMDEVVAHTKEPMIKHFHEFVAHHSKK